jgi:hypothetical protein
MDSLLILHAAVTCFLCGLIWTVQSVHYPLFASVGRSEFTRYEREHQIRITRVVGPLMLAELVAATWLLVDRPAWVPAWAPAAGILLLAWIWGSTAALAVPRHRELATGFSSTAHRGLLRANWHRTVAWSMRATLALWMIDSREVPL